MRDNIYVFLVSFRKRVKALWWANVDTSFSNTAASFGVPQLSIAIEYTRKVRLNEQSDLLCLAVYTCR